LEKIVNWKNSLAPKLTAIMNQLRIIPAVGTRVGLAAGAEFLRADPEGGRVFRCRNISPGQLIPKPFSFRVRR
jgi:hypothetical protein